MPTSRARTVYEHANASVQGFLEAFEIIRGNDGPARGRPAHTEQDQLRAALIFAAAGLDSTLKELIRGTIRELAKYDALVRKELETFVNRQIRGDADDPEAKLGTKFLSKVLISDTPLRAVIEEYVLDLTGASLQSADQVLKTLKALGISSQIVGEVNQLKNIFSIRNKIIHELDVNLRLQQGRRNRNDRARDEMVLYSNRLLEIAVATINAVDEKIAQAGRA